VVNPLWVICPFPKRVMLAFLSLSRLACGGVRSKGLLKAKRTYAFVAQNHFSKILIPAGPSSL
jgi:hypothetical protein